MSPELEELLARAREAARARGGRRLTIATPGMFTAYGRRGRYPAVSLTGSACGLGCDHCRGRLLESMLPAADPEALAALARRLAARGQRGFLLSGGSDRRGRLPWDRFLPAIARAVEETGLTVTVHAARLSPDQARGLKQAGVRQALVDVVGEADTARRVLHLADGLAAQEETIAACAQAGLELAPHIILGLDRGRMRGEERALELVAASGARRVVLVVLMPLAGTPLAGVEPPGPEEAAAFLARARLRLPELTHHLGCARPRGRHRARLDALAVAAGVDVLAIPSDGALDTARRLGIQVDYADTCCSLAGPGSPPYGEAP